jgi:hypothetical protein
MPRAKNPSRIAHDRAVLEKRASIAKMNDSISKTRTRLKTARIELVALRKGR